MEFGRTSLRALVQRHVSHIPIGLLRDRGILGVGDLKCCDCHDAHGIGGSERSKERGVSNFGGFHEVSGYETGSGRFSRIDRGEVLLCGDMVRRLSLCSLA
jgi:hypothetical protein